MKSDSCSEAGKRRFGIRSIKWLECNIWEGWIGECVLSLYLQVYNLRPTRLEPLFHIAQFYRKHEQFQLAWIFAKEYLQTPYPQDLLFIERSIYEIGLPMEYALSCSALEKEEEAASIYREMQGKPVLSHTRNSYRLGLGEQVEYSVVNFPPDISIFLTPFF